MPAARRSRFPSRPLLASTARGRRAPGGRRRAPGGGAARERSRLAFLLSAFAACWFLPAGDARLTGAVVEGLALARSCAREHVLACLVPAFFIGGAIGAFVRQPAVLRYLGAAARRAVAYPLAAVSGVVLSVCSCTMLPLFAGLHRRGAGLGPAAAFLYAAPAINVLAIVLTARVLGFELGVARTVGAVAFAVVTGLLMHALFRREEAVCAAAAPADPLLPPGARRLWQDSRYFASMVGVLVFARKWKGSGAGASPRGTRALAPPQARAEEHPGRAQGLRLRGARRGAPDRGGARVRDDLVRPGRSDMLDVLGPGCRRCRKLHSEAAKAVALAGVEAELGKVEDLDGMLAFGVVLTPALVVNGQVKASGRIARADEIPVWLREAARRPA